MRIHTDKLTWQDMNDAARIARVGFTRLGQYGSRSRNRAFDVILNGESRRRQNQGEDFAATWDQWGVFLAVLFSRDPEMVTPYYTDKGSFDFRTFDRFDGDVWPADAHGDHTFRYSGIPYQQKCTKCSAKQRWQ